MYVFCNLLTNLLFFPCFCYVLQNSVTYKSKILISKNTLLLPEKYSKNFMNNLKEYRVLYEDKQVWI